MGYLYHGKYQYSLVYKDPQWPNNDPQFCCQVCRQRGEGNFPIQGTALLAFDVLCGGWYVVLMVMMEEPQESRPVLENLRGHKQCPGGRLLAAPEC